ncbi:unnamed protein product [Brachionus calyciflorus]|uniref:Uncharacterized protein n=1 Tax=Brachionus calyciflorus TaxID=104777 RepID=A0A814CH99_9BILA|nr:unnamed protein product [Brachionus calyciflorus]
MEKNYVESGSWHKASKVDTPTVTTTLKNLVTLYRKQGRNEAADQLDNCAVKIKKDPSAITQAIEVEVIVVLVYMILVERLITSLMIALNCRLQISNLILKIIGSKITN